MTIPLSPAVAPIRPLAALTLAILGLSALLGACSSGAAAARPTSAATSSAAVSATCNQVSAVLSDGPDPDDDPVGYAQAQILPLSQIRTTDPRLRAAIGDLVSAYRAFYASNGSSSSAKLAVAAAGKRIDSFCPGATS
jgi:hypothetical protein